MNRTAHVCLLLSLAVTGSASFSACGGARRDASVAKSSANAYFLGDGDDDDSARIGGLGDEDDLYIREWGRPSGASEVRTAAPVLRRYYAAAAAGDGVAACALLTARLKATASNEIGAFLPPEYRPAAGSSVLGGGKSCGQVEALLFRIDRPLLREESATRSVARAYTLGPAMLVVMRFKHDPERLMELRREGGVWRIDTLIDRSLL